MTAPGILYGVGVGPGDPELMTLKARRVIAAADVVAHFAKRGRRGIARGIADRLLGPSPRELCLTYPMTDEVPVEDPAYAAGIGAFYEDAAAAVAGALAAGDSVAVLCEGDPFLYGSYMHLHRRLAGRFTTEVVPGVPGMAGAWSRASLPMAWGDDGLVVLPGTLAEAVLAERLAAAEAAVVMKLGGNLPKVRRALVQAGLAERAVYVERACMAGERVVPLADLPPAHAAPYFALILVPGLGRRL